MRAISRDQIEVMQSLGFDTFRVAAHDRGARCAYRLALDEPDMVTRLAVMDVVPVGSAYDRSDNKFSSATWVWSFLAAPHPVPE
jgi:haloacetate dehalogenase